MRRGPLAIPLVIAVPLLATACGSSPTYNTVYGRVVLKGSSDASGVHVMATDNADVPTQYTTNTGSDGSYSLVFSYYGTCSEATYTVTIDAPSTFEGHQSTTVSGCRFLPVSDVVFSPYGELSGAATVLGKTTANGGIIVGLAGTSLTAITDDAGRYTLERAPVGTYTVTAVLPGHDPVSVPGLVVTWNAQTTAAAIVLR